MKYLEVSRLFHSSESDQNMKETDTKRITLMRVLGEDAIWYMKYDNSKQNPWSSSSSSSSTGATRRRQESKHATRWNRNPHLTDLRHTSHSRGLLPDCEWIHPNRKWQKTGLNTIIATHFFLAFGYTWSQPRNLSNLIGCRAARIICYNEYYRILPIEQWSLLLDYCSISIAGAGSSNPVTFRGFDSSGTQTVTKSMTIATAYAVYDLLEFSTMLPRWKLTFLFPVLLALTISSLYSQYRRSEL